MTISKKLKEATVGEYIVTAYEDQDKYNDPKGGVYFATNYVIYVCRKSNPSHVVYEFNTTKSYWRAKFQRLLQEL